MANDGNVRTLPQVLMIAKAILDANKADEFVAACEGDKNLFVVSTEASREFIAKFLTDHDINPASAVISTFRYGDDRCT